MKLSDAQKQRKDKLEAIKAELNRRLYGIEEQVSAFIDSVTTWYVTPELITCPVVINLWGMTGVGKTELVRNFIDLAELNDRYNEILCNSNSDSRLSYTLDSYAMYPDAEGRGGVIYLDEFQAINAREEAKGGRRAGQGTFADIWDILSTGKIVRTISRMEMMDTIANIKRRISQKNNPQIRENDSVEAAPSIYRALDMKNFLGINKTVEEVAVMSDEQLLAAAQSRLSTLNKFQYVKDYTKILFINSGNMDEVFYAARDVSRVDVDADVVYESTKDVTIFDIKRALGTRFFPEQVARLGNNHIIFHSINKANYKRIIDTTLQKISDNVKSKYAVDLIFDATVKEMIYRNGVFPTQGTRPLFSTINTLIAAAVPKILYNATGSNEIVVRYNNTNFMLFTDQYKERVIGCVDEEMLRLNDDIDEKRLTSVHEMGHALVYAELFQAIPPAIVSLVADTAVAAGYISMHPIRHTSKTLKNFIITGLAGMAAEEVVFDPTLRSIGCSSDLRVTTTAAASYVRKYAMTDNIKAVVGGDEMSFNDIAGTSKFINEFIVECLNEAKRIIAENKDLHRQLTELLFEKTTVSPEEFAAISVKFGKAYKIEPFNKKIIAPYNKMYNEMRNNALDPKPVVSNEHGMQDYASMLDDDFNFCT